MSESKSLAEVLRAHGIYGFNGSQVACRCSQRNWRYLLDWHDHVADALSPVLAQMKREWQAEALRAFARKWGLWVVQGAPQIRGGAAYRAICEAREIASAEASGREGERD